MEKAVMQEKLRARFPGRPFPDCEFLPEGIKLDGADLVEVCAFLRDDPDFQMDFLMVLTAVDYPPDRIQVVYDLYSYTHRHRLGLKVDLNREKPVIPSVHHLWRTAEWHEREVWDLFGVEFTGNPDLRPIMLPEDWRHLFPLRKDFTHPNLVPMPEESIDYRQMPVYKGEV